MAEPPGNWQAALRQHQEDLYAHGPAVSRLRLESRPDVERNGGRISNLEVAVERLRQFQAMLTGALILLSVLFGGAGAYLIGHLR